MSEPEWLRLNRANWDERVAVHLAPESDYDLTGLHSGHKELHAIEEAELGPIAGLRLLHLQCHFGADTLALAQRGADVTGLDFSGEAIAAARKLATEIGINANFVQSDLYAARDALEGHFDRIFTSWGTTIWLPDIAHWAKVIESLLAPGGVFYFADIHPMALVFDDETGQDGKPGWYAPYFHTEALVIEDASDYANPVARLEHQRTHQFIHPVASTVQALLDAGLRIDMLHEHPTLAWRQFSSMVATEGQLYHFPDKPWLPLSYSLKATKP
jgi:2-polyprenyl-3-methyl-5-hydroxy-6-metoxy-1,4-benzoquinol methylase